MRHRRSPSPAAALFLLPLVLVACGDPSPTAAPTDGYSLLEPGTATLLQGSELRLTVESSTFKAGRAAALVLENGSHEVVAFNLCYYALERRSQGAWHRAREQERRVCNRVVHTLTPGGTARYDTRLPSSLPRAEYRFRIAVYLTEREQIRDLATHSFFAGS